MIDRILNFIFPPKCILCGQVLSADTCICICAVCMNDLEFDSWRFTKIDDKNIRYNYIDGILSLCLYKGKIKKSLHRYKFSNKSQYFRTYGRLLSERLKNTVEFNDIDMIIAVPLHKNRERERGYNQAKLISKVISKETGIPDRSYVLSRVRDTAAQRLLSRSERQRNVLDAFKVIEPQKVRDKAVLLVDDILTTGNTINECSKVLKTHGAKKVYGIVIASGRRDLIG